MMMFNSEKEEVEIFKFDTNGDDFGILNARSQFEEYSIIQI